MNGCYKIFDNAYFQKKTTISAGCQIDYIIQTKLNTLFIFEIKFSKRRIAVSFIESLILATIFDFLLGTCKK